MPRVFWWILCLVALCGLVLGGLVLARGGVRYTVSPSSGAAPLTVQFRASADAPATFTWRFPDDASSQTGEDVSHTFYQAGTHTVRLEAEFADGSRAEGQTRIAVQSGGEERARITMLYNTGKLLTLDSQHSVIYGPIKHVRWTLPDGVQREGRSTQLGLQNSVALVLLEIERNDGQVFKQQLEVRSGALTGNTAFENEVFGLTNAARQKAWNCENKNFSGSPLPALKRNRFLDRAARAQAVALALYGFFDHNNPHDESTPAMRASSSGYAWRQVAENIAAGQPKPSDVVDAWLRSPGHCHNIMRPELQDLGVAFVAGGQDKRSRWVQVFGQPSQ